MEQIILKKLSGEDKAAKVGKIMMKVGQMVQLGEALFNAESAKGNFLVKSEYKGTITKILIEEGQQVRIGMAVAEIEGEKAEKTEEQNGGYRFGLAAPQKEELSFDVAVIGGGPGGYVAAIRAAQLGAKVVLVEKNKIGGTCLNSGCIPTKSFVKSAHLCDEIRKCEEFGLRTTEPEIDLDKIVKRKNKVVSQLGEGIKHLLTQWNIRYLEGEAVIRGETITVKNSKIDAVITAKNIIVATGSSPAKLNIPGADLPAVMTNEEILELTEIPQTLTVIGGGVIGMEFAFIFNSFGTKVTIVEFADTILPTLDQDLGEIIAEECRQRDIHIHTSAKVEEIAMAENGMAIITFSKGESRQFAVGERVLMSVGRTPNLSALDLASLGVEYNERKNGIRVDDSMLTSNPAVYAIGDVTGKILLAHIASHQGIVAAEHCMGRESKMDYAAVPSAVFLSPEIGVVGLCEKEAQKAGIPYKVSKFPFAANGKALSQGETEGFVKLLYSEEEKRILGGAIIGPGATDLISGLTYHILHKTDYRTMGHVIFAHPTTAESIHEAILGISGEAIHFA